MSSVKVKFRIILSVFMLVAWVGRSEVDFASMKTAEKKFNEQQRKQVVAFMSLDTMFSDPSVRALAKAAGKGKVKEIDRLVAQGANVNSRGTQNATPLYWALRNYEGFKRLLELGADPNVVFGDGGSVVHSAVIQKDKRLLKAVLQHGGNPNLVSSSGFHDTPIFDAISVDVETIDFLLDAGADINFRNSEGYTPLLSAANIARFDIVYELLQRKADYKVKCNSGQDLAEMIASDIKRMNPKHELYAWVEKVVAWLRSHGVAI